ncbi:MAG: tetratricopeptide repeat protein [Saprospiraceae bacterium]|nr:tetratricopeptide repeat protein [Lewinella sp.]
MTYKTIFSGRLEFGNNRSFDQVRKMFEHRKEQYYRSDIALDGEDIFDEDNHLLDIPRFITQTSEKTWRNTINLLQTLAQFAIAGDLNAWMTDEGTLMHTVIIEPKGDKTAIQHFLRGRELIKEEGMEQEARESLSRAIDKFERHALAYERRGFVNYKLGNFKDALYDYNKSIDINPRKANPYFGKAVILKTQKEYEQAITQFEQVTKTAMPLESLHWIARRMKGECLQQLGDHDAAAKEFRFFINRNFGKDDPNYSRRRQVHFLYAKTLLEMGRKAEALQNLEKATSTAIGREHASEQEIKAFREAHFEQMAEQV